MTGNGSSRPLPVVPDGDGIDDLTTVMSAIPRMPERGSAAGSEGAEISSFFSTPRACINRLRKSFRETRACSRCWDTALQHAEICPATSPDQFTRNDLPERGVSSQKASFGSQVRFPRL